MRRKTILIAIGIVTCGVIFSGSFLFFWKTMFNCPAVLPVVEARIGREVFMLEVATVPDELECGLSFRKELLPNHGMVFVFKNNDFHGFWMKDMLFPIDIVWLSLDLEVLGLIDASPESYPHVFYPPEAIRYVLELPSGALQESGLGIGDRIDIPRGFEKLEKD